MAQAFFYFAFFTSILNEAISEDQNRFRLLRQEAENRRSTDFRSFEVEGNGITAPLSGFRGLGEIQHHDVNTSLDEGLSEVALAARSGFDDPACKKILRKVRTLFGAHEHQQITEGVSASQRLHVLVVNDSLTKLEDGNATEESLDLILAALGNLTLKSALQTGNVWSASDQSQFFYSCFPGLTPFKELEERNFLGDVETQAFQETTVELASDDPHVELHEVRYCFRLGTAVGAKRAFLAAKRHIEEQVPCLRFTAVKPQPTLQGCAVFPAIEVRDENSGCWSAYSKESPAESAEKTTLLNLGRGCEMKGMAIHQLFKLLGIRKESSRVDRDKYLNVRIEHLREPWMKKFFAKRQAPPPLQAYETDPFDYLSINMYPAQAFSNGNNSLEPVHDPLLAHFLGQRLGLSELDAEALGDLYGCPTKIAPDNPTRVLAQLFLDGRGLRVDGSCVDNSEAGQNLTLLLQGDYENCAAISNHHCADERVAKMCPFSCLRCVPAGAEALAQRELLLKEGLKYCDDANCKTFDEEGRACKTSNPEARRIPCNNSQQILDLEAANISTDCADVEKTGIKIKSGPEASCKDLRGYCGDEEVGSKVRGACPSTCIVEGFACFVNTTATVNSSLSGEGCRDREKHEKPILMLFGKAQDCHGVRQYCFHHSNSSDVQLKCPFSCGACVPKTGYRPEEEAASFEAAHEFPSNKSTGNTTKAIKG